MKNFFKGVRKHIDKLDANHLREQYEIVSDEFARSEMIVHMLSEGIVRLDARGEVLQANPAARALLGEEVGERLRALAVPRGRNARLDVKITYPEARSLEIQTQPIDDETLVILRDTTAERARNEEELKAGASQAVRDLAAGVAHEIGNPLNAISLNLQLLERDFGENESIRLCMDQVKRLDGIIRSFLGALRDPQPNLRRASPTEPLKNCLAAMKVQFVERNIAVTVDVPAALPATAIDPEQLEQVYFNLVKNALEAMKDGGRLSIRVGADDASVFLAFKDDGEGIPADQLARLFEPYHTTKASGNGLGLMISRRIVERHGGTLAAESTVGEGTTFTVRLPRLEKRVREIEVQAE